MTVAWTPRGTLTVPANPVPAEPGRYVKFVTLKLAVDHCGRHHLEVIRHRDEGGHAGKADR